MRRKLNKVEPDPEMINMIDSRKEHESNYDKYTPYVQEDKVGAY